MSDYPLERTVIVDFNDVINNITLLLEDNGIFTAHIDFFPILEHICDIVILGSMYEQHTGDSFREALDHQHVTTEIYTQLSKELRDSIMSKFVEVSDFFNDDVHFHINWHKSDYVATVQVFHVNEEIQPY